MKQSVQSLATALLIAVLAVLSQTGCKENTIANSKLAPNIDNINTFGDTLKAITNTYLDDTLQTSITIGGIPVDHALGVINADPYFGTTNAAMYFQVIPADGTTGLNLADYTFDSAVLILPYSGFRWGDTLTPSTQTFTAYRITDTMSTTTPYYSYSSKAIDANHPLGSATVNVNTLQDSVSVLGVNQAPHLRIHLDSTLIAEYLINNDSVTNASSFTTFLNGFPGICVKAANPNQQSHVLPYFRLDPNGGGTFYSAASIAIYAHPTTPGSGLPSYDSIPITALSFDETYCAHFNSIYHDYRNYPVNALFQAYKQHPNVSASVVALQNQPGAAIDLKLFGIKGIPTSVINKAELDITLVSTNNPAADNMFSQPSQLYPLGIDSNGLEYTIADRYPLTSTTPLGVLDGFPHTFNYGLISVTTYTINMPRELQAAIIAQRDTIHLHINGTQDYYGAYRMVAGGSTTPFDGYHDINMKVVYSKLKN